MGNDLKIAIVGDVLVTHRLPNNKQLEDISSLFKEHHCVIGNLETVVRKDEGYPEAFPGGGSCFCHPGSLSDLKKWDLVCSQQVITIQWIMDMVVCWQH